MLKPLFARVLLEREKAAMIGNIVIPDEVRARHSGLKCRVLAVGPNADDQINVGSWVLIGQHAGAWLDENGAPVATADDAKLYIVQDEDILCEVSDG